MIPGTPCLAMPHSAHQRISRLPACLRCALQARCASITANAVVSKLGAPLAKARRTITHDDSTAFTAHETIMAKTGMRAFFCDPHSPWQHGGIENANGPIRRDLPGNSSLSGCTDDDIAEVIWHLNSTRRKCLGFRTPIEAFAARFGVAIETWIQRREEDAHRSRRSGASRMIGASTPGTSVEIRFH